MPNDDPFYLALKKSSYNKVNDYIDLDSFVQHNNNNLNLSISEKNVSIDSSNNLIIDPFYHLKEYDNNLGEIKDIFITDVELEQIKNVIKKIKWNKISNDWTIKRSKYSKYNGKTITLDPYSICSDENPLYMHRGWLKHIYDDEDLKLTDLKIAKICGKTISTINRWRKKFNIPKRVGTGRWIHDGRAELYMPKDYQHPEILRYKKGVSRLEHVVVMERYLSKHPELKRSKKYLIKGKYLKKGCVVHHINFIPLDNRIKNLWIFENLNEHILSGNTLTKCFRDLIKLGQIIFKKGEYYLKNNFNYKSLGSLKIKEILRSIVVKDFRDIDFIKETIKNINWKEISDDWRIEISKKDHNSRIIKSNSTYKMINLNPYFECSEKNPLYRHKKWIEYLINKNELNLTDLRLGKVCGVPKSTIQYWRERVYKVYTRSKIWGFGRYIKKEGPREYIYIRIPEDYFNPIAKANMGFMSEHRYKMERYLAEHPELEISKKYLFDDKFLKSECPVHHINLDPLDNRLENLWVCESANIHKKIETSLLTFVDELLRNNFLIFRKGKYYLDY